MPRRSGTAKPEEYAANSRHDLLRPAALAGLAPPAILASLTLSLFLALPGGPGVVSNLPVELPRDLAATSFILLQPIFIAASPKQKIWRPILENVARESE
jgi:hypothetical protein